MIIEKEDAILIIKSMQQCRDVNGFMDPDDKDLYDRLKRDFKLYNIDWRND